MHSLKRVIRDSLLVVLGNAVVAFGVAVFAVPSDLIVGGATGLSLIIEQFVSVNYATIVFGINMVNSLLGLYLVLSSFLFS